MLKSILPVNLMSPSSVITLLFLSFLDQLAFFSVSFPWLPVLVLWTQYASVVSEDISCSTYI